MLKKFGKVFCSLVILFVVSLVLSSCDQLHSHTFVEYKSSETEHWKECSCGEKNEVEEHTFGEWKTIKEPTETNLGEKERECSICKYKAKESIPLKNPVSTEGLEYELSSDKKSYSVVSIGTAKDVSNLVIPMTYQNLPVESIGLDCFADNVNLKNVTLSSNIKFVDERAFSECKNIENVYYLGTLEEWCKVTFNSSTANPCVYQSSLHMINKSGILEKITTLTIPSEMSELSPFQFIGIKDLTDIIIPEGITKIGRVAFASSPNLKSIELPKSLKMIDNDAFVECEGIQTVKYNGTIEDYCKLEIINIYASPLKNATAVYMLDQNKESKLITKIEIPETITELSENIFYGWASLTEVLISKSVKKIGYNVFYECTSLEKILYEGSKTEWEKIEGIVYSGIPQEMIYFYSEEKPQGKGNYWHYINNQITIWEPTIHNHTFEKWFTDSQEHWHQCEECQEIEDKKQHSFDSYQVCSVCKYKAIIETLGLEYELNEDGKSYAVVGAGNVTDEKVFIPSKYNGLPITKVKSYAFTSDYKTLRSVVLGENVEIVETGAFNDTIESLYVGKKVKKIENLGSKKLAHLYYEGTLENWCNLEVGMIFDFYNVVATYSLTHFYLRNSNNEWEEVTSIEIPNTITEIGNCQFLSFTNITSVTMSDSVKEIGEQAFAGCLHLKNVNLSNEITKLNGLCFFYCWSLSYVNLGNKLQVIENQAFQYCLSLYTLTIPENVVHIEGSAFENCRALAEIYNLSKLNISKASTNNGYVGFYAFKIHTSLEEKSCLIEQEDFIYCKDEENKYYIIAYKGSEVNVSLPESIEGNSYSLAGTILSSDAKSFIIPKALKEVKGGTMLNPQKSNVKIYYEGTIEDWCNIKFISNSNPMLHANHFYLRNSNNEWEEVTSIEIPNTITEIGNYQFGGFFNNVTSIVIPYSVTSIGEYAFYNCSSLTSVVIPDSVTSIGEFAFYNCSSLTSVVIPDSVTSIGKYAFYNCNSLQEVYYTGTISDWNKIDIYFGCSPLTSATRYYYSETQPTEEGNYWHYVGGVPTKW